MTSEKGSRKEKNQNIQVFVRLRPLNQRERDIKSIGVVEVVNGREVVVRQSQQTSHTKRFTFDRAFGPHVKQVEVYQEVVSPLIEEVLAGYNCTVFAYGQTGTGKTHTMVGESTGDETTWQNDPLAGIIPRALSQLFDELRLTNNEYTVRVSYLELYNEELFDLLASSDDNSKLRIYEDVSRKGSNIVNGLEEITVYNKNEVYKIMSQGQERKRVASTLMNAQSSRSHTVFTIVVHMKENSPEGEELVKIGKLNLVDLAGSENISKAGSDNPAKRERARECVNINQSLLTLGRVITALVERHPHIPYRESKLTRILQESLGGRTKTSIIATVSPGHKDLEETMSTLEYANRAKNIQNKPEVNQKMTKKAILKEYSEEIDRLKRDLQAARDKNGVYLANETFAEMTLKQEEQRKEIQELLLRKRALEEERDRMDSVFSDQGQKLQERESELNNTKEILNKTKMELANTCNMLQSTRIQCEEQQQLVEWQRKVEKELTSQAQQILAAADQATAHLHFLHDAYDKRKSVEARNARTAASFVRACAESRSRVASAADAFRDAFFAALHRAREAAETHTTENIQMYEDSKTKLEQLVTDATNEMSALTELKEQLNKKISKSGSEQEAQIRASLEALSAGMRSDLEKSAEESVSLLNNLAELDVEGAVSTCLDPWRSAAEERISAVQERSEELYQSGLRMASSWTEALRSRETRARGQRGQLDRAVLAHRQLMQEDEELTRAKLSEQLAEIERDREDTETRLKQWAEEERRLVEERISKQLTRERTALEERLKRRRLLVEEQDRLFQERSTQSREWLQAILYANRQEETGAELELRRLEEEAEECSEGLEALRERCRGEIAALSSNVESLIADILNVAKQVKGQMSEGLNQASGRIKAETESLASKNAQSTEELALSLEEATKAFALLCTSGVAELSNEANRGFCGRSETLRELVLRCRSALLSWPQHSSAQSGRLEEGRGLLQHFLQQLHQELDEQSEMQRARLQEQWARYSPTGRTPMRREYRYPRRLANGSPRRRIRGTFPAPEPATATESATATEPPATAVAIATATATATAIATAPAEEPDCVLVQSAPCTPAPLPVAKSTSETDLYARQKCQEASSAGKENLSRSASFRKPSKLPAPSSLKKPLLESN